VIAEDIFLADVGSGAFTGYEVDKGGFKNVDIIQMYDAFPGLLEGKQKNHHIHTHHSMGTFFSGTDWEQLEDRGILCNYFIMLIVDFKGDYKAKVAFKGNKKVDAAPVIEFANNADGLTPFKLKQGEQEEVLVVMDMKIQYPAVSHQVPLSQDVRKVMAELSLEESAEESYLEVLLQYLGDAVKHKTYLVDEPFRLRYESVVKAIEEDKKSFKGFANSGNNYGGYGSGSGVQGKLSYGQGGHEDYDWHRDWEWNPAQGWEKKDKKSKKISEMTDKEFSKTQEVSWDEQHIKILLNACISGSLHTDAVTSPIVALKAKAKKMKRKEDREEWIEEFGQNISLQAYELWSNEITAQDALNLLELTMDYLEPYRTDKFIESICLTIEAEAGYMQEEAEWYSQHPQRGGYA
jgi:hypothetical protein